MNIKGTAVKSIINFIRKKHPNRYDDWLKELPKESISYFDEGILSGNWYPVQEAYIEPTKAVAKLFYNGDTDKAAYDLGVYSAQEALAGIYKIFVRMASMSYILKKLKTIFATYYSSGTVEIIDEGKIKYFKLIGFSKGEEIIAARITGWAEGLFTAINKKPSKATYTITELKNNYIEPIIKVEWN